MKVFDDVIFPLVKGIIFWILWGVTWPFRWVIYKISNAIKKQKLHDKNKLRL